MQWPPKIGGFLGPQDWQGKLQTWETQSVGLQKGKKIEKTSWKPEFLVFFFWCYVSFLVRWRFLRFEFGPFNSFSWLCTSLARTCNHHSSWEMTWPQDLVNVPQKVPPTANFGKGQTSQATKISNFCLRGCPILVVLSMVSKHFLPKVFQNSVPMFKQSFWFCF